MTETLPQGWIKTTLGEVCAINPPMRFDHLVTDDTKVSFVPMAAVEQEPDALMLHRLELSHRCEQPTDLSQRTMFFSQGLLPAWRTERSHWLLG